MWRGRRWGRVTPRLGAAGAAVVLTLGEDVLPVHDIYFSGARNIAASDTRNIAASGTRNIATRVN